MAVAVLMMLGACRSQDDRVSDGDPAGAVPGTTAPPSALLLEGDVIDERTTPGDVIRAALEITNVSERPVVVQDGSCTTFGWFYDATGERVDDGVECLKGPGQRTLAAGDTLRRTVSVRTSSADGRSHLPPGTYQLVAVMLGSNGEYWAAPPVSVSIRQ